MSYTLEPKIGYSTYPKLWLGTWSLGGEGFGAVDGRESVQLLVNALHDGFRHFDSAQFYAHGKSDAYLAKAIKRSQLKREEIFISGKGGLLWEGNQVHHNGSEKNLRTTLQKTLDTYQTDYLDLYQLHWPDPSTPLAESLEYLKQMQKEGLIRYWGVGNLCGEQLSILSHESGGKPIPHQVHHNPLHRNDDILTAGKQNERCFNCSISPFEQGLLSRRNYRETQTKLGKKDVRRRNPYFQLPQYQTWLKDYYQATENLPFPRSVLLLLWQLNQSLVDAVIIGPKKPEQFTEISQALANLDDTDISSFIHHLDNIAPLPTGLGKAKHRTGC